MTDSAPIAFVDIETCGLDLDDPVWEIAVIRRDPGGPDIEHHMFVTHGSACTGLPDRFRDDHDRRYDASRAVSPEGAAAELTRIFGADRPHFVGAVPNFDDARLGALLRRHGVPILPWHYHLICVEALMVGALAARGVRAPLPWRSDDLAARFGVEIRDADRHTAMGDARWARDIYDAVMTGTVTE